MQVRIGAFNTDLWKGGLQSNTVTYLNETSHAVLLVAVICPETNAHANRSMELL